jgi:hypothetical protein
MQGIWQKVMIGWGLFVALFGAVLSGGGFAGLDGPALALMERMGGDVPVVDAPLRFALGLMGAVTLGWGLTVLAVASVSHLLGTDVSRVLWQRIGAALLLWYVIDCAISISTGFGLNAASNTVLLGSFLLIAWRAGVWRAPSAASGGAADAAGSRSAG